MTWHVPWRLGHDLLWHPRLLKAMSSEFLNITAGGLPMADRLQVAGARLVTFEASQINNTPASYSTRKHSQPHRAGRLSQRRHSPGVQRTSSTSRLGLLAPLAAVLSATNAIRHGGMMAFHDDSQISKACSLITSWKMSEVIICTAIQQATMSTRRRNIMICQTRFRNAGRNGGVSADQQRTGGGAGE